MNKIKVMVVDDSAVVRQSICDLLSADPEMLVIGAANDPIIAMQKMERVWPDVIVLDIEMPRMDGLTFLAKIMKERPTPVVICSTLVQRGADAALRAMSLGAVTCVEKPKLGLVKFFENAASDIVFAVKQASVSKISAIEKMSNRQAPPVAFDPIYGAAPKERVIAIGTSMGGVKALEYLLPQMPEDSPGIVIVQHMPAGFTGPFAQRLSLMCKIDVIEASDGDTVEKGLALIAPGGKHMMLRRGVGGGYFVNVVDGPLVNRHIPSVDVLMRSVAKSAGSNAVAAILTGMGDDGAYGILDVREAGGYTIAESEETCIVYGMPKEAIKLGAICEKLPLFEIAKELQKKSRRSIV